MNYRRLFVQFPKWAIATSIFGVSTSLFIFWWVFQKPDKPNRGSAKQAESTVDAPPAPTAPPLKLAGKTLLLGDRSLYEFREGTVHLLEENWFSASLGSFDQPVFLEKFNILLVGGPDNGVSVFASSGTKIGNLRLASGGAFDGYLADNYSVAVFAKDGNLWRGDIDWPKAKIVNETQATTLGYIHGRPLKGRLLGATSKAVVYRDNRFGIVGINLETGESQQLQFPANIVPSPSGRLIVGDTPTRPPQFVAFDVNTFEYITHSIPWRIQQNGLVWLSETKAALILNDQIQVYNHDDQTLTSIYQAESPQGRLTLAALPVQGHPYLMFQDPTKGILSINVDTQETHLVVGPPINSIQMLENGDFLLSSDVPNSEQRGTWLGKFGEKDLRRVFAQPLADHNGTSRSGPLSILSIPGTDYALIKAFGCWQILNVITGDIADFGSGTNRFQIIQS